MISRGVPLPSIFLYYQWDTGSFVWGRGILLCFISSCFVSIVLVLVVYSIVSGSYMSYVLF